MTDVLTVTLNPALDVATSCARLESIHKLRCTRATRFPGGGGINVARVMHRLGGQVQALYLAGGVVGRRLQELIQAERVPEQCLPIADETRESFSVLETGSGHEYRFVLPGPEVSALEWRSCLDVVAAFDPTPRTVVLSGSLPPGLAVDSYAQLARVAHARGCKVVLDSSGAPLAAALDARVHLVKPSLRELSELVGAPLLEETQWRAAAQALVRDGRAEMVALSLGERGAMLLGPAGVWHADALRVDVKSTTGAGDSFLGALVWALERGTGMPEALRYAVAAGSAALLHEGTSLCRADDVADFVRRVHVRRVA
ncbi:MAG: 1-phosphofructokinase family hexose kinase [Gammaproteobacteria bacterium]|nr:1-phosphofructokinase family hexose kinase [Gammaproteobacteria bacterium]